VERVTHINASNPPRQRLKHSRQSTHNKYRKHMNPISIDAVFFMFSLLLRIELVWSTISTTFISNQ
jgi:hypothetical protein